MSPRRRDDLVRRVDDAAVPAAESAPKGFYVAMVGAPSDGQTAVYDNALGYFVPATAGSTALSWKQAVRAATTAAGTLASSFENGDAIDGVTLATGDRILIKNQAAGAENGIYTVNASGAPTRATDADSAAEMLQATVLVSEGTTNADTQWTCSTNAPITLGTTAVTFSQMAGSGAPSSAQYVTLATDATLTNERVLTAGTGISITDGGAGGNVTITNTGTTVFVGARVYHNASQSIANTGIVALALNSERYDTDGFHDTVTNNSRLTVPSGKAGKYEITGTIEFVANSNGIRQIAIRVNGTTYVASHVQNAVGSSTVTHMAIATVTMLAVGDYVELMVNQSGAATLNVTSQAQYSPEFTISLLGA